MHQHLPVVAGPAGKGDADAALSLQVLVYLKIHLRTRMTGKRPEHEYSARPLPDPAAYSMVYPKVCAGLHGPAWRLQTDVCVFGIKPGLYARNQASTNHWNLARR